MHINQPYSPIKFAAYSISKYAKNTFVGLLTTCLFFISLATILPVNAQNARGFTLSTDQVEYDYGSVSVRVDTSKYANQSAKMFFCLETTYVDFDGQELLFSYPLTPFISKTSADSENFVNDSVYDLTIFDDKTSLDFSLDSKSKSSISIFDVTKVVFEDQIAADFYNSIYNEKNIIEYNENGELLVNGKKTDIPAFKTSYNFCGHAENYSGKINLNSFNVKSIGSNFFRTYELVATSNNFVLGNPVDVSGKDLVKEDILSGKCQSYSQAWKYDEALNYWVFDDKAGNSVAPGDFVTCSFKLKDGVYYNSVSDFYDEKTAQYYSQWEIEPKGITPTYNKNGCYITTNLFNSDRDGVYNPFENNALICSFGVPFKAQNGIYKVELKYNQNPGPNQTSQIITTQADFKIDRSLIREFDDVDAEYAFSDYIYTLKNLGVVSGSGDNQFNPENSVTRGEMAKFVVNAFFGPGYSNENCSGFSDIDNSNTFYYQIQTLKCEEVISGFADGTFKADEPITRGQAMKFMVEGARAASNNPALFDAAEPTKIFKDVKTGNTFYDYIVDGVANGIANGYGDGTFQPDKNITRGEMSKIVLNTWEKAKLNKQGEDKMLSATNAKISKGF